MKIMIDEKDLLKIIAENLHHDEGVRLLKIIKKKSATFSDDEIKFTSKGVTKAYRHPRECELNKGQNIDCTIDCMCPPKEKIIEKLKQVGK